jgi:predicted RNA binding protein YcfA (HicA-like mRNA interferase family)
MWTSSNGFRDKGGQRTKGDHHSYTHTNTENTLFGTLEPIVSIVDFKAKKSLKILIE